MRRTFEFSKTTFQKMGIQQQHKKCFELLKELFVNRDERLFQEYNKLCDWMGIEPLTNDIQAIEERFHKHIQLSGRGVSEHDFLQNLIVGDKKDAGPWLSVHTFLDGLRSCHNVGSIMRTIEAFRLGPVHFSDDMMPTHHPQIQKTSMGAWNCVPINQGNPPRPWIGLETVDNAFTWNEWIYPQEFTLVVGNEERGIRDNLLKDCDIIITIPLTGRKNSLNVANAFAIVASEIASQHRKK